jgi:hypothetical protein
VGTETTRVIWKSLVTWPPLMSFLYKFLCRVFTSHIFCGRETWAVCLLSRRRIDWPCFRFYFAAVITLASTGVWVVMLFSGIASVCFMLRLLFDSEDGGGVFFRSVGLSPNYKVLKPTGPYSSNSGFWVRNFGGVWWSSFLFPQVAVVWLLPSLLSYQNALPQFRQFRI